MYEPQSLRVTGAISIEPVTGHIPKQPKPYLYLIMGPTGAGKSSFIEALAGESQQLSISKDQLEGYTQTVNAYHLVNVMSSNFFTRRLVYVIDTPGFSDSKISEIEVMDMIRMWLNDNDLTSVHTVLFLTPITHTRLPGTRRRTLEMLRHFLQPHVGAIRLFCVTTMWDTIHNERTENRAESNYVQLNREFDKYFSRSAFVTIRYFENTQESALIVMSTALARIWTDSFSKPMSSVSPHLYQDLHDRIEGALQKKQRIESDLAEPQTDAELSVILERNQRENHEILTKFIGQLANFGPPPPGFHQAAQGLRRTVQPRLLRRTLYLSKLSKSGHRNRTFSKNLY